MKDKGLFCIYSYIGVYRSLQKVKDVENLLFNFKIRYKHAVRRFSILKSMVNAQRSQESADLSMDETFRDVTNSLKELRDLEKDLKEMEDEMQLWLLFFTLDSIICIEQKDPFLNPGVYEDDKLKGELFFFKLLANLLGDYILYKSNNAVKEKSR